MMTPPRTPSDACLKMLYRRRRDTNAYYAAMYLLTSNDDIYRRTANCFCKDGIEFGYEQLATAKRNAEQILHGTPSRQKKHEQER